jgi:ectoine hydroxylase
MLLDDSQLRSYGEMGFLLLPNCIAHGLIEPLRAEAAHLAGEDAPGRVLERDGKSTRSVYGAHKTNPLFGLLIRHARLVGPAMQILASDVYVHQFKVNAKKAFAGDIWEWHQDFVYWRNEDGMPSARVLNALIFLDDVNEFNGPLLLIPRSHLRGVIGGQCDMPKADLPSWSDHVGAKLQYALTRDVIAELVDQNGIVAPKGSAGSVLLFDANICHGSASNMSPFDRAVAIVTYNSVLNMPIPPAAPRPEFLADSDHEAVECLDEEAILKRAQTLLSA